RRRSNTWRPSAIPPIPKNHLCPDYNRSHQLRKSHRKTHLSKEHIRNSTSLQTGWPKEDFRLKPWPSSKSDNMTSQPYSRTPTPPLLVLPAEGQPLVSVHQTYSSF